ncbi:hypothetical protein HYQ46_009820 [Verticillium longisporum]|nr:hypothetical protein HYQ46_009820 [Verticillium longisporum]
MLGALWHRIGRLDADEEPPLEVQDGVDIQENLVDGVTGDDALGLEAALQIMQILEILHIFPLGVNQLLNNKQATLLREIEHGLDWIVRIELLEVGTKVGNLGESHFERHTQVIERARGIGLLVDDVSRGYDGPAILGCRGGGRRSSSRG